jgi:precorrin-6B methylase 2
LTDYAATRPAPPSLLVRILRRLLPAGLYRTVRAVVMTLVTPTAYAAQYGYYRSAFRKAVVDGSGDAAPWLTFPLVAFLSSRSFAGRSVLEFGSGQSSIWWARRAKNVLALETDPEWTKRVRAAAPENLVVADVPLDYDSADAFAADVRELTRGERYDVVVVDGGDRIKAMLTAPEFLTDDGFVVVDDLDLFRTQPDWAEAVESLRRAGFGCIDFHGMAVGAPFTRRFRCSSLFLRSSSFVTD